MNHFLFCKLGVDTFRHFEDAKSVILFELVRRTRVRRDQMRSICSCTPNSQVRSVSIMQRADIRAPGAQQVAGRPLDAAGARGPRGGTESHARCPCLQLLSLQPDPRGERTSAPHKVSYAKRTSRTLPRLRVCELAKVHKIL